MRLSNAMNAKYCEPAGFPRSGSLLPLYLFVGLLTPAVCVPHGRLMPKYCRMRQNFDMPIIDSLAVQDANGLPRRLLMSTITINMNNGMLAKKSFLSKNSFLYARQPYSNYRGFIVKNIAIIFFIHL